MLVLERVCSTNARLRGLDTIVIGTGENEIQIVLIETRLGHKASIGISAPKDVRIMRKEIMDREEQGE